MEPRGGKTVTERQLSRMADRHRPRERKDTLDTSALGEFEQIFARMADRAEERASARASISPETRYILEILQTEHTVQQLAEKIGMTTVGAQTALFRRLLPRGHVRRNKRSRCGVGRGWEYVYVATVKP